MKRKCLDCKKKFTPTEKRPNAEDCLKCSRRKKNEARKLSLEIDKEHRRTDAIWREFYISEHKPPAMALENNDEISEISPVPY